MKTLDHRGNRTFRFLFPTGLVRNCAQRITEPVEFLTPLHPSEEGQPDQDDEENRTTDLVES